MPKEKIIRAAGYIRNSDPRKEHNFSPGFQRDKIVEYCRQNRIPINEEHIFSDKYTGSVWRERKGLQKLLAAAKRHEFDILVCYKLDRLSRDHIDQIVIREQLKYYGITIVTLDPDEHASGDDIGSQIIQTVYGFQAEIERKNILERCNDGRQNRAKGGHLITGNKPLYGYNWCDKWEERNGTMVLVKKSFYVINPEEATVVVMIFELAADGVSLRKISFILTEKGIKTPTGKDVWEHHTVRWILTHPYYKGVAHVFKRAQEFVPGEGAKRHYRTEEELVAMPDGVVPAIVDEALWNDAQRQIAMNKNLSARNTRDPEATLFRGFIYCGHCGSRMVIRSNKRDGIYYRCRKVADSLKGYCDCNNGTIMAHIADRMGWEKVQEFIRNPDLIDAQIERQKKEDPTEDEVAAFDSLIEGLIPKIVNLTETIENTPRGHAQSILLLRLEEVGKQKTDLEERRDKVLRHTVNWKEAQKSLDDFKDWCNRNAAKLADRTYEPTYQEKLNAIRKLGIRVIIYRKDHKPRLTVEVAPPEIIDVLCSDGVIYLTGRNLR